MANNTPPGGFTKSQPVVLLGAMIIALTSLIDGLQAVFKDNPTIVLVLSVVGLVVGALAIFKDQYVKGLVVPVKDTYSYIDQAGNPVAGPASSLAPATPITSMQADPGSEMEAGGDPVPPVVEDPYSPGPNVL